MSYDWNEMRELEFLDLFNKKALEDGKRISAKLAGYDWKETFDRCEQDYLSPPERETECRHQSIVSSCCDAKMDRDNRTCYECENNCWEYCEDCDMLLDL